MKVLADLLYYLFHPIIHGFQLAPLAMLGIFFPIVPILVALPRRRRLPPSLRWALLYLVCTFVEDVFMIYWSRHGRHNLWIMNLYTPIEAIILGMMFARWELRDRWRTVIYVALASYLLFWAMTTGLVEGLDAFPQFSKPVEALLVIAAAAWTLVQRSRHTASPLTLHPWFWVSVGTLLYFTYVMLLDPVAVMLLAKRQDLWKLAFYINGVLATVMYLFWLRAILLVRSPSKAEAAA